MYLAEHLASKSNIIFLQLMYFSFSKINHKHLAYIIKMKWFFFHSYLSLYLIQIHISEPISTKLCTRFPFLLEEVVWYVWTHNILPSSATSVRSQCRILGTTWLPAPESLRQRYVCDPADDTCTKSHP
jgi:hypothetical protein